MGGSLGVGEPEQRTEALPRCGESQSALGCHCCSGGKGCCENSPFSFFFLFFFYMREQTSGISSFMVHPLMPWFLSDCGWIFSCWGKAFVRPQDSPPFPLFCSSFSLRWDEFGQNRRGSESTAAPRRGPRVSFTENLKQQQGNFRELKQRVFGHWLGRYTARVLVATRFLL